MKIKINRSALLWLIVSFLFTTSLHAQSSTLTFNAPADGTNIGAILNDGNFSNDISGIQLDIFVAYSAYDATNKVAIGSFLFFQGGSYFSSNAVAHTLDETGTNYDPDFHFYYIVIKSHDGSRFNFNSIYFEEPEFSSNINFEGFRNGASTGTDGVGFTLPGPTATLSFTTEPISSKFQNVDEVRITVPETITKLGFNNIEIKPLAPTITSISPTSGPPSGGTAVTITGTSLASATSVKFGSTTANITSNTATSITATAPAGSAGTVHVTVTTVVGTSSTSSADQYTYVSPPVATTGTVSAITLTGTTLNGTINANNASTAITFEYGKTNSYGTTATATPNTATGSSATPASTTIAGLEPNTTYHYRIVGVNVGGTTQGADQTFTTASPTITSATYNASNGSLVLTCTNITSGDQIASNKITLTGEGSTTYTLTSGSFNASSSTSVTITLNSTDQATVNQIFNKNDVSSTGGITYNLAAADDWDANITAGNTADATTGITVSNLAVPTVTTQAVTSILSTTATGNGNITSLGVPNPTQYGVVWSTSSGPTIALSTKTTQGAIAATGAFTSSITGLSANTTYYVKAYATNNVGTSYGTEVSFTTPTGGTWIGGFSSDWSNPQNWAGGIVPTSSVDVTIPVVVSPQVAPIVTQDPGSPAICQNLTIQPGAVVTVAPGKVLSLSGTLANNSLGGILIQSDATGTGSMIIGSASGTGTIAAQRYMTGGAWHMVSSPLSGGTPGQTIASFLAANTNIATDGSTRGMMDFDPVSNSWHSYFTNGTPGNLNVGEGFAVHILTGTVTFSGTPRAGVQTISGLSADNWNCIGNPYTSAIGINTGSGSTDNFLNANAIDAHNLDPSYGAIYVWDKTDTYNGQPGNYTVISNAVPNNTAFNVQQGQGFFVKMNTAATSVSFTPAMQYHNPSLALKASGKAWPMIKLLASVNNQSSATTIVFNSAMTKGLDPTYDAGLLKGGADLVVYSKLINDNGIPFAIQALPDNDFKDIIIPIGVDYKTGGEVIFTSVNTDLPADCKVILEDKLTNTFTDLSTSGYKAVLAANSSVTDRFQIHTSTQTTIINKVADKLSAYAIKNIGIHVIGDVSKDAIATLYDIHGRVVLNKNLMAGNENIIQLPNLKNGIYLLSVKDKGTLKGFKIMIRE